MLIWTFFWFYAPGRILLDRAEGYRVPADLVPLSKVPKLEGKSCQGVLRDKSSDNNACNQI